MKTKFLLTVLSLTIIFSIACANLCFAQIPEITREYIVKKEQDVRTREEKVTADYKGIQVTDGDYLKVTFLDGEDSVLAEYDINLDIYELSGLNLSLNYDELYGAEYIVLTICGSDYVDNGVKLPFKIY